MPFLRQLVLLLLFLPIGLFAQQKNLTIRGTVRDTLGNPLVGASVKKEVGGV